MFDFLEVKIIEEALTCIALALMPMEMGPFFMSQRASLTSSSGSCLPPITFAMTCAVSE